MTMKKKKKKTLKTARSRFREFFCRRICTARSLLGGFCDTPFLAKLGSVVFITA